MNIDEELNKAFDDPLLSVSDEQQKLFAIPTDMKMVMEEKRKQPDHVARRWVCEDFDKYNALFTQVHHDLKTGKRQLARTTKTDSIKEGRFYIIDGQLLLLAEIGDMKKAANGTQDARTRCVMENGTETDVLLQTLRKNIVYNGYAVTEMQEVSTCDYFKRKEITVDDAVTGYVYVLQSLSDNAEIKNIKNLYKIGFTTNEVEERIANATNEPTYLMAPVKIVSKYTIVNMNSQKFETLVHQVLRDVNFRFRVTDDKGCEHEATEWYVVPLEIIDSIISRIIDGTIVRYSYNKELECLELHQTKKFAQLDLAGLRVLTLNIKKMFFEQILSGRKKKEYRDIKQTTIKKYTYVDPADGKRYLRPYDVLKLYVGYHRDRDSAVVEVKNITHEGNEVVYHLGKVLEVKRGGKE